jgi:hypothetical protein
VCFMRCISTNANTKSLMQNVRAITNAHFSGREIGSNRLVEYEVDVVEKVTWLSQI